MDLETTGDYKRQLLKAEEVALILKMSKPRVYQLAREVLPAGVVVRIRRQIRFDHQALVDWIASGGTLKPSMQKGENTDAASK